MTAALAPSSALPLRPARELMRLARLGAAFPTRLSFMRILLRALAADKVQVTRPVWDMCDRGYGVAVYSLTFGGHDYSLIAVSNALADEHRSDRVIAEAWDAAFVLYDGLPSAEDVARIRQAAPRQEAARFTVKELTLSRANKSARLFEEVVCALAAGHQPDLERLEQIGYLMRTTAVYGNGKFGIADRFQFSDRPGMSAPFQAEMLTVWLIRAFTHDLVEHMAVRRAPETAVRLAPHLKRHLGIGNSTGLGMAPFLVSHPRLLNAWVLARETALQRVLAAGHISQGQAKELQDYARRIQTHLHDWTVKDLRQQSSIETLRAEFDALDFRAPTWQALWSQAAGMSLECQELVQAILIDLNGPLVDDLAETLSPKSKVDWHHKATVAEVLLKIHQSYAWALAYDFDDPDESALFWYTSEEKLEPRLGRRDEEPGAELERPLDIARQIQRLYTALQVADPKQKLAFFFVSHPDLRAVANRVLLCHDLPYAEIQDNLIADTCLPIHMLRFKLAMFGANKFDPKSDLWTRITLFQGAPLIDDPDLAADWGFAHL